MVWLTPEGEKEIVLAGTAPVPSEAAPAVALAAEPPMVGPKVEEVSAATILDDTPMVASEPPPAKVAKSDPDELTKLLDPQGAPVVVAKPAPAPARVAAKPPAKKPVVLAKAPAKVNPSAGEATMVASLDPVTPTTVT